MAESSLFLRTGINNINATLQTASEKVDIVLLWMYSKLKNIRKLLCLHSVEQSTRCRVYSSIIQTLKGMAFQALK